MNRTPRIAVAILIAAPSAAILAGCGGGTTLDLTVKNTKRVVVDLGAPGASQGDLLTVDGDLIGANDDVIGAFRLNAAVAESTRIPGCTATGLPVRQPGYGNRATGSTERGPLPQAACTLRESR